MFEFLQEWTAYQILTFIFLLITSLITVSLGLKRLYNWHRFRKEKKEYEEIMKDPLEVHFFIPREKTIKISYAKQDSQIHDTDELEIPKGIEDIICLRIKPRIDVKVREIYFGFIISDKRKTPEILHREPDPFYTKTSSPRKWRQDLHGHLHYLEERIFTTTEIYPYACKIKTFNSDTGDYTFYIVFQVSRNEYKSIKEEKHKKIENFSLKIRVTLKETTTV